MSVRFEKLGSTQDQTVFLDSTFPHLLRAFYINRDCDHDRRSHIESQLINVGMLGERTPAVDGLDVPDELRHYFFSSEQKTTPLTPGEVGCYASHLKTLALIGKSGLKCALVLEDDALLPH